LVIVKEYSLGGKKVKKSQLDGKMIAYIKSISLKGEVIVRFSEPILEFSDFKALYKMNALHFYIRTAQGRKSNVTVDYEILYILDDKIKI